ncbi:39S ribosomal protein L17, mitochondrial isoform X2 [Hemicordylus capensis]|uniref:39S ribosomal protein L17, mitochondrial isoform X2 n=1 Tax=Hemicordylus capensis TaxID=884348 RepID=UPI002303B31A|nr:39S ribosomal protein L17, mitochondrial isoform X2 [Hemicordylus capensis]
MRLSVAAWISHGHVQRRFGLGLRSRLDLLRNLVTGLVRHERIEAPRARVDEMRFYAEREKDLLHKLFKVLAPRFQAYERNYTRMLQIPNRDNLDRAKMAVIEYKGNPFPPLPCPHKDSEKTLVNQLLKGYREDILRTRETQNLAGTVSTAV